VPLNDYGVVIGTLVSFTRDPQHNYGHWYHGHISVQTPQGNWESALDVDTPAGLGVAYRLVDGLSSADLGPVASLADGWHPLAPNPTSGACDYVRSPALRDQTWLDWLRRIIDRLRLRRMSVRAWEAADHVKPARPGALPDARAPRFGPAPFTPTPVDRALLLPLVRAMHVFPWITSNGDNALDALEPHVMAASRLYVFGQHYTNPDGVHDVHMNQGDPAGSQWYPANGAWQDGLVASEKADGSVVVWQVKFNNQSLSTDANGNPV
jgi:hypothetical protein